MFEKHIPVLLKEAINGLNIKQNGIYVDMTLGRAGHFFEILTHLNNTGLAIGIDQDEEAINDSLNFLKNNSKYNNYKIVKDNFSNIKEIVQSLNIEKVDGFIFDLGVSSPQFDETERGFSYRNNAVLDMRMNQDNTLTANYIVNNYSLNDLTKIFKEYGEEKYSYNIAKNIVKERSKKRIETTLELVEIIKNSLPKKELEKKGHPAKQVFQSLRIEVNDELNVLKKALIDSLDLLKIGGRICAITFQSLEDKIVKDIFNSKAKIIRSRRNLFDEKEPDFKLVNTKVIVPNEEELEKNPRSKSAKLRIIERIK